MGIVLIRLVSLVSIPKETRSIAINITEIYDKFFHPENWELLCPTEQWKLHDDDTNWKGFFPVIGPLWGESTGHLGITQPDGHRVIYFSNEKVKSKPTFVVNPMSIILLI